MIFCEANGIIYLTADHHFPPLGRIGIAALQSKEDNRGPWSNTHSLWTRSLQSSIHHPVNAAKILFPLSATLPSAATVTLLYEMEGTAHGSICRSRNFAGGRQVRKVVIGKAFAPASIGAGALTGGGGNSSRSVSISIPGKRVGGSGGAHTNERREIFDQVWAWRDQVKAKHIFLVHFSDDHQQLATRLTSGNGFGLTKSYNGQLSGGLDGCATH
jgi:hypothetical protein